MGKENKISALTSVLGRLDPKSLKRTRDRMALAARLEELLLERGLSKTQFAKLMGKEASVITKWLSGTNNFQTDTLSDISEVLGFPMSKFFEEKEDPMLYSKQIFVQGSVGRPVYPKKFVGKKFAWGGPAYPVGFPVAKTETLKAYWFDTDSYDQGKLSVVGIGEQNRFAGTVTDEDSEAFALVNAKPYRK